jgi:glycosyltransferase involved in cell wall biosynthesis
LVARRKLDEISWVYAIAKDTAMFISVVICTYNPNEKTLARALDSILSQDLNREEWELLLIDNNSTEPVRMLDSVARRQVRVEFEGRQGLSAARHCGLKNSRGDVIVYVDDDNVLENDYLRNVKAIFSAPGIGIVSGTIIPEYEKKPADWFSEFESMLAIRRPTSERPYLTNIPFFSEHFPIGAGMAVRREIIENYYIALANGSAYIAGRVGAQLSSAEDIDLDFYAISEGFFVGTVGSLKMKHIIPAARLKLDYLSRLASASTISSAEVNRKWKHVFGADVFSFFLLKQRGISFRLIISAVLYWIPKYRIRYHFYKTLAKLVTK